MPAWAAEKICWRLSDEYHAPKAVGGHVRIYRKSELLAKISLAGLEPRGWIKRIHYTLHTAEMQAVGPTNDSHKLVKAYHRFLVLGHSQKTPNYTVP